VLTFCSFRPPGTIRVLQGQLLARELILPAMKISARSSAKLQCRGSGWTVGKEGYTGVQCRRREQWTTRQEGDESGIKNELMGELMGEAC